jgi:hypothetical protein
VQPLVNCATRQHHSKTSQSTMDSTVLMLAGGGMLSWQADRLTG